MLYTEEERNQLCCDAINTFLFDKVWNEPVSEYRFNVRPYLYKNKSFTGSFSAYDGNVILPTLNEPYYIYVINGQDFLGGLNLPSKQWVDTATICNEYRTLIHMYGINGAMFAKSAVYFCYSGNRQIIFIAVKKNMLKKCIPLNSVDNVFFTVYFDSDIPNIVKVHSVTMKHIKEERTLYQDIDAFLDNLEGDHQLQVYKNGVEVTNVQELPTLEPGDYVDYVIDKNILFAFDVDLTTTSENPVYLSKMDKTWKQLIHIPKELNPENKIFTHNTCDFYVRKALTDTVEGYYLHRASNQAVSNVTHNDFGIPLYVIDAYRDYLRQQEVYVHVVVRQHDKDNKLIQDASFINLLYCEYHDDQKIIDILRGKGPSNIPWWTAPELEASAYVKMMFDTPNYATTDNVKDYVAALGFYHVANLLCKRIVDITITDGFTGKLTFNLPLMYNGRKVTPIIYKDKKAISSQKYSYTNNGDNTITVYFDSTQIYLTPGDKLHVFFYLNDNNPVITFVSGEGTRTVEVPYKHVVIHRKVDVAYDIEGINTTSQTYYELLEPNANQYATTETEDGVRVTFNSRYDGDLLLIQGEFSSYAKMYDLKQYTKDGKSIAIPIRIQATGTDDYYPILSYKNVVVYLNGKYLVKNIDYFINDVKDKASDCISFSELVVQTMDYFNEEGGDVLEVLFNIAEQEDLSSGFEIDDRVMDESPVNLYYENITSVHVNGELERNVDNRGIYLKLPPNTYEQGSIFEVQTCIPKLIKDFLLQFASNQDKERIAILNDYFYNLIFSEPAFLMLEKKHRIYSVFMNNILYAIVNGKMGLVADPDRNRMEAQIKSFMYLKDMDLCFRNLDQRFVDYYPQYVNYEVEPVVKNIVDSFIREFMPRNNDPTMEVVHE